MDLIVTFRSKFKTNQNKLQKRKNKMDHVKEVEEHSILFEESMLIALKIHLKKRIRTIKKQENHKKEWLN